MTEEDTRLEKAIEHAGDLFMVSLGFEMLRFSQARATQQTPGIPDRRYYRPAISRENAPRSTRGAGDKSYAIWWESKTARGQQSPFQRSFQHLCQSCGEVYLVGTDTVLHDWAEREGLVRRLPNGWEIIR